MTRRCPQVKDCPSRVSEPRDDSFEGGTGDVVISGSGTNQVEAWPRALVKQILLVGGAIFLYFGVRGVTERQAVTAFKNARSVLAFETRFLIDIELAAQEWLLPHDWVVTAANWVYIWGHWPVVITTLVWLFARHRDEYLLLRNALFISGAIGLIIFVAFPVAPPRLLPEFVDTVTERSSSYRVLQPPALVNKYAAVPSLHFGWNLLTGIVLYRVARIRLTQIYAIVGPILMGLAVVVTANHFVLDALIGGLVAVAGLVVAVLIRRSGEGRQLSSGTDSPGESCRVP